MCVCLCMCACVCVRICMCVCVRFVCIVMAAFCPLRNASEVYVTVIVKVNVSAAHAAPAVQRGVGRRER